MKFFVLLLTAIISLASTFGIEHENKVNLNERIYGGITAVRSNFPWQVSVQSSPTMLGPSNMLCGGSIISSMWVLTACRCVFRKARCDIGVGTVNLYFPLYTVYSNVIIPHPRCNPSRNFDNDIALIKLSNPLNWLPNQVESVLLARASTPNLLQQRCMISGWGQTPASSPSLVLLFTVGRVVNCIVPSVGTICTIGSSSLIQRACHKDNGGALVYNERTSTGTNIIAQIGIFSYPYGGICTGANPGVYTRITPYLIWISSTTGIPIRP